MKACGASSWWSKGGPGGTRPLMWSPAGNPNQGKPEILKSHFNFSEQAKLISHFSCPPWFHVVFIAAVFFNGLLRSIETTSDLLLRYSVSSLTSNGRISGMVNWTHPLCWNCFLCLRWDDYLPNMIQHMVCKHSSCFSSLCISEHRFGNNKYWRFPKWLKYFFMPWTAWNYWINWCGQLIHYLNQI